MFTHMLVQIPALLLSGTLLGFPGSIAPDARRSRPGGIPGLLAVSLVLAFWMLPIALDHAVADPAWDAAKATSLVLAGITVRTAWVSVPGVIQAFFVGNVAWMAATAGLLFQDAGERLCNAYLQDDQAITGTSLVWLAVTSACVWIARLAARSHGDSATTPQPGTSDGAPAIQRTVS